MAKTELSMEYGGRKLVLETGWLAKQADASVVARYGDTVVLVSICSAKELKEDQDFFPLTVDFQEKYYAAGRIPGGFFKREARPTEKATLSARLIDRPMRPLFPEDFLCDTFVTATVLSSDGENEPDIVASIAASAAAHISDIPWAGPVGTCRVGYIDGRFVVNPTPAEQSKSELELLVAGVRTGVIMVEGAAKEVSEKRMADAIEFAHEQMQPLMDLQDELRKLVGKAKREYPKPVRDEQLKKDMKEALWGPLGEAFAVREKLARYTALDGVKAKAKELFAIPEPKTKEESARNKLVKLYFEELKAAYARELTLQSKKRIDGRGYGDIRPITCEVGVLPRVHGTAVFTRGETQVLAAVTLGTSEDEQKVDGINGTYHKSFLLHYNFPPFSVGEARPLRASGRREIGHGYLAERALSFIIPPKEVFPYTVRVVSEVLESNGSSSMATVCAGSMALMDAGVPVPKPVAGVAMGLIKEGDAVAVLSDILGDEDHLGDMDFKVCGTSDGITAFQMDLKIGGVSKEIFEAALAQAREGRLHILSKMAEAITEPRREVSPYAPRIFTIKVRPEKVREVIGTGGKVVRGIIEKTGVKIDIEDDGTIHIASTDEKSAQAAIDLIQQIVQEAEVGKIYEGKVSRIADFGAFVEIFPGTDGLCHISELDLQRVRVVEDVVREGDIIRVKCLEVDASGKIRLSRKAVLAMEQGIPHTPSPRGGRDRNGRGEASAEREVRLERELRPEREPRPERESRGEREPRPERESRGEREPRPGRDARSAREERGGDRSERVPRSERELRPEREARPERGDRERGERDRGERGFRSERGGDWERAGRGSRGGERGARGEDRGNRGDDRGNRSDRDSGRGRFRNDDDRDNFGNRIDEAPRRDTSRYEREQPAYLTSARGDRGERSERYRGDDFGNRREGGGGNGGGFGGNRDRGGRDARGRDERGGNRSLGERSPRRAYDDDESRSRYRDDDE
jgi:polyribonucleotide nucleotidyltransferase